MVYFSIGSHPDWHMHVQRAVSAASPWSHHAASRQEQDAVHAKASRLGGSHSSKLGQDAAGYESNVLAVMVHLDLVVL